MTYIPIKLEKKELQITVNQSFTPPTTKKQAPLDFLKKHSQKGKN